MKILKVTNLSNGNIEQSDFQSEQECLDHKAYLETIGYDFTNTHSFEILSGFNKFNPISPRQIRLALLSLGVSQEMVKSQIDLLPSPTNQQALIAWEYSTYFERNAPLVESLGLALGLTIEQLDALWIQAKDL